MQEGRPPLKDALPSFTDIQSAVGFPQYYADAARYAVSGAAEPQEAKPPPDAAQASESTAAVEVAVEFASDDNDSSPDALADMDRCAFPCHEPSVACNWRCNPTPEWPCRRASASLEQELSSLDMDDDRNSVQNGTPDAASTSNGPTPVVEPDAIVVSSNGRQQGEGEAAR